MLQKQKQNVNEDHMLRSFGGGGVGGEWGESGVWRIQPLNYGYH